MRKSSFLFAVAAALLVSSAASPPARGGSFLYTATTAVHITSDTGSSAEYAFEGPIIAGSATIFPVQSLIQPEISPLEVYYPFATPDALDIGFFPLPVGVYPLNFTFLSFDPSLTPPTTATSVDGTGYIVIISLSAVPEPPSLVLLGIGAVLGPLGYTWRRRAGGVPVPEKASGTE
jgi:hypothetical protein